MIRPFENLVPEIDASAFVADSAVVMGDVHLGPESSIWYGSVVRGDVHRIRIGAQTNIQDRCVIHVTHGRFSTTVGDRVTVGHGCIVHGCEIGDEVLVGMGAVVLDGVRVDRGSVVAAGALLPPGKHFPGESLIVGSPARVVRPVKPGELSWIRASATHYVSLAQRHAALTPSPGKR